MDETEFMLVGGSFNLHNDDDSVMIMLAATAPADKDEAPELIFGAKYKLTMTYDPRK